MIEKFAEVSRSEREKSSSSAKSLTALGLVWPALLLRGHPSPLFSFSLSLRDTTGLLSAAYRFYTKETTLVPLIK